ncbi:MAG: HNH endonuclease [Carboxylicivirga sp.]|nr:HNH endonuclease [Carboxylicivirga sp.]
MSGVLETERTTANISEPALSGAEGTKAKIATVDTLTVDQGSLTVNPVAVIRYQLDNHLGSASLELDENAAIISYEEYHPFGTTSYRSGRTETETSQKRYKYVGKERDEETGLYYYGFRYYAAWLCRFISVDPLQFEYPHYTPFQYAGNKPITYIDLDGLEEAKPDDKNENSLSNWFWNDTKTGRGLTNIYKLFTGELKFSNGYEDLPQYTSEKQDDGSYAVHNNQASFFGIPYRATTTAATEADIPNEINRLKAYEIAVFGFESIGIAEGGALDIGASIPKRIPKKTNLVPTRSSVKNLDGTPVKSRLPKTKGKWIEGTRGNGIWKSEIDEVNAITKGEGIPFKNGYPDFSKWEFGKIEVKGMTGTNKDFSLGYKKMMEEYGFETQKQAADWLKENGITLHHMEDGIHLQLVPSDLHNNIPHRGGASILRIL